MAKRAASSQLTHDNWDQEEEPEEGGTFKTASSDILKKRVIKVAKRRNTSSAPSVPLKNVFSGFTGFGNMKPMASARDVANTAKTSFSFLNSSGDKKPESPKVNSNYLSRLRSLNEEVVSWINKNVTTSPCCILTPVFQDYEKYLKDIQKEYGVDADGKSINQESPSSTLGSFGSNKPEASNSDSKDLKEISKENMFTFGEPKTNSQPFASPFSLTKSSPSLDSGLKTSVAKTTKESVSSDVSFTLTSTEKPSIPAFGSSATSTPSFFTSLSSGNSPGGFFSSLNKSSSTPAASEENKEAANGGGVDEEAEQEEPPKNEFTLVKEEGAVFTQRVKVFVKKDDNFKDHGVGNLYLKETPTGKYQAIVRADTSLGNILFNVILSKDTPTKRVGKNNVMLVVVPTPEAKPPPVPVLLRVKTSEDADKLLEKIDEFKK